MGFWATPPALLKTVQEDRAFRCIPVVPWK